MSADASLRTRILVIKLGALGDIVQALGPMAAIRRHHAGAHITALTTEPYVEFLRASGLFDEVAADRRPAWWQWRDWMALRDWLRARQFTRVYDLQTSARSSFYLRLMGTPAPEWSGIARGCSHPHADPRRDFMHTADRQAEQLRMAGIADAPPPDLAFCRADAARFGLKEKFALLVPGGSPDRPRKRWPADRYTALARRLAVRGIQPVVLGKGEAALVHSVARAGQGASLADKTAYADIVELARRACAAVGNDTGPMHLIAAAGCPSLVLFSSDSDPGLCAPRGPAVRTLRRQRLEDLSVQEVEAALPMR